MAVHVAERSRLIHHCDQATPTAVFHHLARGDLFCDGKSLEDSILNPFRVLGERPATL